MKFGGFEFTRSHGSDKAGLWMTKPGGAPQNITVPAVVTLAVLVALFCCCARVVF